MHCAKAGWQGASFLNGHFATISKEPTGHPQRRWFKEVPNDGLIRYRTLLNQERILPTTHEAFKEVLSTKSYEFVKPSMTRNGLARILGVGILLAEGEEHKVWQLWSHGCSVLTSVMIRGNVDHWIRPLRPAISETYILLSGLYPASWFMR